MRSLFLGVLSMSADATPKFDFVTLKQFNSVNLWYGSETVDMTLDRQILYI